MNHDDVRARLSEYLEGELALRQRALVDAHLDGCPSCREALTDLRAAVDVLHGLGDLDPGGRIADAVMARIRAGEAEPTVWSRLVEALEALTQPRVVRPLALAAVGAVVLVAAQPNVGVVLARAMSAAFGGASPHAIDASDRPAQLAGIEVRRGGPRPLGASSLDAEPAPLDARVASAWSTGFGLPHTIELQRDQAARHMHPIWIATPIIPASRPSPGLRPLEPFGPGFPPAAPAAPSPVIDATPVSAPYDGGR